MICQHCQKRQASIHISRSINGRRSELHLCNECAHALGADTLSLFRRGVSGLTRPAGEKSERLCPKCGSRLVDERGTGLLSCSGCGDYFENIYAPAVKRPKATAAAPPSPLAEKQAALKEAIEKEDFERAARLRDEIKGLRKNENNS